MANCTGRWAEELNSPGSILSVENGRVVFKNTVHPVTWIFNEYSFEVDFGNNKWIYILSTNNGKLYGYPAEQSGKAYYERYSKLQ